MKVRPKRYQPKTALGRFLDQRLPFPRLICESLFHYQVPKNLNYFYTFGGILCVCLLSQLLTGLVMALHYIPEIHSAFASREFFVREGRYGWLFSSWHTLGASFFFVAAYIHMARSLYYGSHKSPRELVWMIGVVIYLLMLMIAFAGYMLSWSQLSLSAAMVITSMLHAIPMIGPFFSEMILGDYEIGQQLLSRFYVLHYLLSFLLLFFVALHIFALHHVGQNNPDGIVSSELETVPFMPYAAIKDSVAIAVFLCIFVWFLFFMPDFMTNPAHYIQADMLKPAQNSVPEWYFLPFYAMVRAMNFNIGGLSSAAIGGIVVFLSIVLLFFIPWLDRSTIRSARYRPWYRLFFWIFIADMGFLSWFAAQPYSDGQMIGLWVGVAYYFCFFLIILPCLPYFEKNLDCQ